MEYPKFKVCVRCDTYNQSKYIIDAMNGFVMQQTDFPFVCCIVDDASTDGEQDVIKEYFESNFESNFDLSENSCFFERETDYARITYARHISNRNCYFVVLYLKENHYSIAKPKLPYLSEWRDICEYEAICEGDDWWTESLKLQWQCDYLDNHPFCGLVWSRARRYLQDSHKFAGITGEKTESLKELLLRNGVPTLTAMYRKSATEGYEECVAGEHWLLGDLPLWLYISTHSDLHCKMNVSGVYRILKYSASHNASFHKDMEFENSVYDVASFFASRYCPEEHSGLRQRHIARSLQISFSYRKYDSVISNYMLLDHKTAKDRVKYVLSCVMLKIK